jgi:hypothetical protein
MDNSNCPVCGNAFERLQGAYAPDGAIVCKPCGERLGAAARSRDKEQKAGAFAGAWGSLLIAALSFVIEHRFLFFLFPLIALGGGLGTAWVAARNPESIVALGRKRWPTVVLGALAALLGALSLVLSLAARG